MYRDSAAVCHVQIRVGETVVAEDMADKFRPDLLQAGIGHGHYAFYADLQPLPPGRHQLRLFDGRSGAPIAHEGDGVHDVPLPPAALPHAVASLLQSRNRWRDDDLLAYPACLQLERNYAEFGPDRFVDRVFRFVLGRWADPSGAEHYAEMLRSGAMTPTEVFLVVLGSHERRQQARPLPRPMDSDFPFIFDPAASQIW